MVAILKSYQFRRRDSRRKDNTTGGEGDHANPQPSIPPSHLEEEEGVPTWHYEQMAIEGGGDKKESRVFPR